jgi:tyrosine-protein kinase Etk/Wzc
MKNLPLDHGPEDLPADVLLPGELRSQEQEFTFLDVILALARQKRFILAFTAICTVLAAIVSFLLPKEYTATVTILPPQQNTSLSGTLAMQLAGLSSLSGMAGGGLGLKSMNDMYVAMLKSTTVEDSVIRRYNLMHEYDKKYYVDARKSLERHTEIDGSNKDGLIRLSFESRDPNRAAEVANGYVEQFRTLSQHLAISEASQRRVIFEQQLEKTNKDLANAEEALKATELSTGMVQVDSQARALIESAARLRAEVTAKEVQIDAMHTYAAPDNPALAEAQQELDGLRAQFAKLVGSHGTAADDVFLPKGQIPQAGLEYIRRLRNVKYYEAIFDILARQLELAKLDEAKEGAFIQVVDAAAPPERKSFPKRTLITLAAAALGFSLAIMFALFQAGLSRLRSDPAKSEKLFLIHQALVQQKHDVENEQDILEGRNGRRKVAGHSQSL